ncbi:MAG: substrate-binding domain-containing protein [Pseudomonadota bacterium]
MARLTLVFVATLLASTTLGRSQSILVQSTTSTENSGLYDHLLPVFEKKTGISVNIVSVGTGQAIKNARNCDADILLVHSKPDEEEFVSDGYGIKRHDLMYNDFIIIGPPDDPAGISGSSEASSALRKISMQESVFASRGDNSGTHKKELTLWRKANIDPDIHSGTWYRSTGSGMGATLNAAVGMGAYSITDRATWLSFANKADFKILFEGDPSLHNQYGIIRVNEKKCPASNHADSQTFFDWMVSPEGQAKIANFKLNGKQVFFPNAPASAM